MLDKLKSIATNWKAWALWFMMLVAVLLVRHFTGWDVPTPPLPPLQPQFQTGPDSANFGWHKDEAAVAAVAAAQPFKAFGDTPAGKVAEIPDSFYQWEVFRKVDPKGPPAKNQLNVGSCVSFGTNNAVLRTMACQIALGAAEELKDIAEEVTYGGSRVEIGGGRIRGDGSVGAWAAQFVQKYGVLARGTYGRHDLSAYSTATCRQFGDRGVPDDIEAEVKKHFVKDITLVKTTDELKKALSQGYGVAVCSDQGFSMQRDSRGVARASGSWAHCMCIDGYHTEGGRLYFHIENSWGPDAHTGPVGWGNPSTAGFWAEAAVVQRMLSAGDTWAFSGVKGFPARSPDWFVMNHQTRTERVASLSQRKIPCVDSLFALCP